ncbi:MAG: hypothetical protein O6834_00935, partial [Actinobacteria bacterium]|nr:hypothetical protein [Actinomycetota bacterium]
TPRSLSSPNSGSMPDRFCTHCLVAFPCPRDAVIFPFGVFLSMSTLTHIRLVTGHQQWWASLRLRASNYLSDGRTPQEAGRDRRCKRFSEE